MDDVMTIPEVAVKLKVSRSYVYRLIRAGLPTIRLRPGGVTRIRGTDLQRWIDSRERVELDDVLGAVHEHHERGDEQPQRVEAER